MQNPKVPDNEKKTIVEEGTLLDGTLVSSCGIVVNGKIRGEVTAPSLRVNGTGSVHGKAKVDQIVSTGELSGEFEADLVQLAGVVRDETVLPNPRRTYCSQTGRMGLAGMPWVVPVGTSRISALTLGVHSTAQPPLGCITKSVDNNRGSVLGWKSCTLAPPSTSRLSV